MESLVPLGPWLSLGSWVWGRPHLFLAFGSLGPWVLLFLLVCRRLAVRAGHTLHVTRYMSHPAASSLRPLLFHLLSERSQSFSKSQGGVEFLLLTPGSSGPVMAVAPTSPQMSSPSASE